MRVDVLGATRVWLDDGQPVDLGAHKPRSLVAALALSGGRAVSPDTLADLVWEGSPPDGVASTIQAYVSGLRRVLEPGRAPRSTPTVLVTVPPGYALRLEDDALDARVFAARVHAVRRRLGRRTSAWDPPDLDRAGLADALAELDGALGLWRGEPYLELGQAPSAVAERGRLDELRAVAQEDRAAVALALGEQATLAAELESLTREYPLREQLWGLRAVALARSGRQADALDVLAELRRVLDEDLGLEPGAAIQGLQTAVLRQDPALLLDRSAPRPTSPGRTSSPPPVPLPGWPLVGRDPQLATLVGRLDEAVGGVPAFAVLTGEPGIGKSRLCAELAAVATARGIRVVVGRCSQDDVAPPLWPWQQVLTTLGADLGTGPDDEGAEFRTWEGIVRRVRDTAAIEPVVVVLDDLHWADAASLRVLRLLLETVHDGRLLLLATWRSHPEPTGSLADVAESLARRHAARIALTGLGRSDVARILTAVAQVEPTGEQTGALAARTDGNPFFLVEYARLARDSGDLGRLLAGSSPPSAVGDVLSRRLERLPEDTRRVVAWAAVVGREFSLDVLAEAAGRSEDEVLDALEPALDSGLVREQRAGGFGFAHALVRDSSYAALGPTRQARAHAAVAAALDRRVGRATESARHWLDAGPQHAARAWRAAEAAADEARAVHAHDQAASLLEASVDRLTDDPAATDAERYRLLLRLADDYRWQGSWVPMVSAVERAIEVAERIGDVRLLAGAAAHLAIGALWQTAPYAEQNDRIVGALEESLRRLPAEDDELRCRVLLALSSERYYTTTLAERLELIDDALAMARRIGSDRLLLDALEVGYAGQWSPNTRRQRLALAVEAVDLAGRLGAERSLATATTMRACSESELGMLAEMRASADAVRALAGRLQMPFPLMFVETLLVSWAAVAGRHDDAEAALVRVATLANRFTIHNQEYGVGGALASVRMWQGRWDEVLAIIEAFRTAPLPTASAGLVFLFRSGRPDDAREEARSSVIDLTRDDWYSAANWALAAEAAVELGDAELAGAAYDLLAPLAGGAITGGSALALGPADAFLALAAVATGRREDAVRHAAAAEALITSWGLAGCAAWFRDLRERYDF